MNPNNKENNNPFSGPLDDNVNPFQTMNSNPFQSPTQTQTQTQTQTHIMPNFDISVTQQQTNINQTQVQDGADMQKLKDLKEICPTIDNEILELILLNNNNNLEKSLNEALALSDPNYVPVTTSQPIDTQEVSDENLARTIQEEENRLNKFDQTKNDEAYARAILAAEQAYIEDVGRARASSAARRNNNNNNNNNEQNNEGSNSIENFVEATKKKFMGLFKGKNDDSNLHRQLRDDSSPTNEPIPQPIQNERFNNYNIQQDVTLERRDLLKVQSRDSQGNKNGNYDLLNDDPPEDMTLIAPISQLSPKNDFGFNNSRPISPNDNLNTSNSTGRMSPSNSNFNHQNIHNNIGSPSSDNNNLDAFGSNPFLDPNNKDGKSANPFQ